MFVELHVEQGRGLIDLGQPVAIRSSILGHGRLKLTVHGQGNHAGTALMKNRKDPMVAAAKIMVCVRDTAAKYRGARATIGRLQPVPGGTNAIASRVDMWIDVRHLRDEVTAALVGSIHLNAQVMAAEEGCAVTFGGESLSPTVHFDTGLRDQLQTLLSDAPVLGTGAGHHAAAPGRAARCRQDHRLEPAGATWDDSMTSNGWPTGWRFPSPRSSPGPRGPAEIPWIKAAWELSGPPLVLFLGPILQLRALMTKLLH